MFANIIYGAALEKAGLNRDQERLDLLSEINRAVFATIAEQCELRGVCEPGTAIADKDPDRGILLDEKANAVHILLVLHAAQKMGMI